MMKSTRLLIPLFILVLGGIGFFYTFYGSDDSDDVHILRLHHFMPPDANVPRLIFDVWADDVERASNDRIKIERYPLMQLGGSPPELIDQIIDGVADIGFTVVGYTPGRFPRTEVFELPFMMTNSAATSRAYWRMFESHMRDTEFADAKILATWVHGPGTIHSSRPVRNISDLSGLQIRGGSRMVNQLLSELGATPVGMPINSIPESLSKGVIEAATLPWEVTGTFKIPELVTHHTEFVGNALYTLTFVFAMNKSRYESLPSDLRSIIDSHSGEEFSVLAGSSQESFDAPARDISVSRGNNIITLDSSSVEAWRRASLPVYDSWIADMSTKGIDGRALIDEARSLIAEFGE